MPGDDSRDAAARPARTARAWRSKCACLQLRRATSSAERGDMVTTTGRRGSTEPVNESNNPVKLPVSIPLAQQDCVRRKECRPAGHCMRITRVFGHRAGRRTGAAGELGRRECWPACVSEYTRPAGQLGESVCAPIRLTAHGARISGYISGYIRISALGPADLGRDLGL